MVTNTQKVVEEFNKGDFFWKVPSKSNPGENHLVSWSENGGWRCDCIRFQMSPKPKSCRHIKIVKSKWEKKLQNQ